MDKLLISGGIPLEGEIRISGAKNAALPVLIASLLTDQNLVVSNVPHPQDVTTTLELLGHLGVRIEVDDKLAIDVNAAELTSHRAPYELVRTMRASVLVLGPLLTRFGEAEVSLPGGARSAHGQSISYPGVRDDGGASHGRRWLHPGQQPAGRLQGCRIVFDTVTVTGTENLMMAAYWRRRTIWKTQQRTRSRRPR
ncbi:MAG: hypothetical protein Ct9H300mP14_02050 [Gammaproteobacteria bacterium]|nr:MAG: hypothetical protein Ct9H300mP14_02050 [Gammaproteobacteria bacterium]